MKTNAMRLLDQHGVQYEVKEYAVDPDDLTAGTVAQKVGLPPEQVFKTLCVRGDRNGEVLAVIPGNAELNLKALAKLTGDRKMDLLPLKEVLNVTGYQRGAVTAFAAKRDFPVYADETIELFDVISVSVGMRGVQALLKPEDYLRVTGAIVAGLTMD
ncbi:MAG: Cys-tRNA(Pro) deacylase [Bryobacteraceae bacterium]